MPILHTADGLEGVERRMIKLALVAIGLILVRTTLSHFLAVLATMDKQGRNSPLDGDELYGPSCNSEIIANAGSPAKVGVI